MGSLRTTYYGRAVLLGGSQVGLCHAAGIPLRRRRAAPPSHGLLPEKEGHYRTVAPRAGMVRRRARTAGIGRGRSEADDFGKNTSSALSRSSWGQRTAVEPQTVPMKASDPARHSFRRCRRACLIESTGGPSAAHGVVFVPQDALARLRLGVLQPPVFERAISAVARIPFPVRAMI